MIEKYLKPDGLEKIPEDRRKAVLEHRKRQILGMAVRSQEVRKSIIENRDRIAAWFRGAGGENSESIAQDFERLTELSYIRDLLNEVVPDVIAKRSDARRDRIINRPTSSFFVLGEPLNEEQVRAIKSKNLNGGRFGKAQIPISIVDLFRCEERGGTIYINTPRTELLMKQLQVITAMRPDIINRIYFVEWSEPEKPTFTPYKEENPIITRVTDGNIENIRRVEALNKLGEYLYHEPEIGEVYMGTVVDIEDLRDEVGVMGITVEFMPGIKGKMYIRADSENANEKQHQVGSKILIKISNIKGRYSRFEGGWIDPIRKREFILTTRDLEHFTEYGNQPLFAEFSMGGLPLLSEEIL